MKIKRSYLKRIIKEEIKKVFFEDNGPDARAPGESRPEWMDDLGPNLEDVPETTESDPSAEDGEVYTQRMANIEEASTWFRQVYGRDPDTMNDWLRAFNGAEVEEASDQFLCSVGKCPSDYNPEDDPSIPAHDDPSTPA